MSEAQLEWPATAYILHPSVKSYADLVSNPERRKYIRADLVEAAVKRALEGAASKARFFAELNYAAMNYPEEAGMAAANTANEIDGDILCLASDPAQFIEEPKP